MITPETFTAATLNIQHGSDGIYSHLGDAEKVAKAVVRLNADITGLQEVDNRLRRSGYVNQAEFAAYAAGMDCRFAKSGTFRGRGEVGNAILVRGEILDHQVVPLEGDRHTVKVGGREFNLPVSMPRNVQIARVAIAAGVLTVGNLHISGKHPEMLTYAAEKVLEWPGPHMIMADFNMRWPAVQDLLGDFGFTIVPAPGVNSDHIAVRRLDIIGVPHTQPIPGLSDHDPVIGNYAFR